jgi:hypothetical protein
MGMNVCATKISTFYSFRCESSALAFRQTGVSFCSGQDVPLEILA